MADESKQLREFKDAQIAELTARHDRKLITKGSYQFLTKLVEKADTEEEVLHIVELGLVHRKTGLTYVPQVEYDTGMIHYLKRDAEHSFVCEKNAVTHKLIVGDNYPALKNLLITYRGAVDVIYIDPPYGIDDMGQFAKTNYDNAINRDHLLSQLYPRLQLAKQLLSERGVIFCSIDDKNQAYVKCLFDEVFGEVNFIQDVIWNSRKSVSNDAIISLSHNHTLVYVKNKKFFDTIKSEFKLPEEGKGFANPDNDDRGPWKADPFDAPGIRKNLTYPIVNPDTGVQHLPPSGRHWRTDEATYRQYLADNRIVFGKSGKSKPQLKRFLSESISKGVTPKSIWDDVGTTSDGTRELERIVGRNKFSNPKAVSFVQRCVILASTPESVVLDFYAGSGTTAQAVMEQNMIDGGHRQCILVTNNEVTDTTPNGIAFDVTYERILRICTGKASDGSSDFAWLKSHKPYGVNLETYAIEQVSPCEDDKDKCAFSVIDETCYGREPFDDFQDKVEWVCRNFERTQKSGLTGGEE